MNLDYRRFRFTLATFCSSQYLKELFVSCFLSLSIFPPVSPLESGCKGKACFSFSKLFKLFFQTFFPVPRLTSFPRALSLESGCKSSVIKHNLQTFPVLFFKFFSRGGSRTLVIRRYPFSAHVAHHVASRVTTCT